MSGTVSKSMYWNVFKTLIALTVVTVLASRIDIGRGGNIALALLIAGVKATVVGLFFMHLKYEGKQGKWIYTSVFFPILLFLILLGLLTPDVGHRDPGIPPAKAAAKPH